jgi:hypothetical protein
MEGYLLSFSAVQVDEVRKATLRLELVIDRNALCAIELEGSRLSWQPLPPHSYTLEGCDAVLRVQLCSLHTSQRLNTGRQSGAKLGRRAARLFVAPRCGAAGRMQQFCRGAYFLLRTGAVRKRL